MKVKIKRIISWIIDIYMYSIPSFIISKFISPKPYLFPDILNIFFQLIPIYLEFLCILYKDFLFKNRSIGKRITGLYIYQNDQEICDKYILIERNVKTLMTAPFSIFKVLWKNKTIGDSEYNTFVTSKEIDA